MDGARFYGAALTFYEVIPNEALTSFTTQHPQFGSQLKKSLIYVETLPIFANSDSLRPAFVF